MNAQNVLVAKVMKGGKYGLVGTNGKLVVSTQFDNIDVYNDDMAIVQKDNMYGFINKSGAVVVSPQYEEAFNF